MRHQVVDGVERFAGGDGERLGRAYPHHEGACQARPGGDGDRVDVRERHSRLREGLLEGGDERVEVGAGGDLGDHAAEADVFVHGGRDGVRQQGGSPDDADAGFVAGGLDAEHERLGAVHGRPASVGWGLRFAGQLEPHDQGVDAVSVVAGPDVDLFEAEAQVELLGPGVVRPDLEQHVLGVPAPAFRDQLGEQGRADALAFLLGHHGDGLDVRDRFDAHEPGIAHDPAVHLRHEVAAGIRLRQLVVEHLQRPGIHGKEPEFQGVDGGDVRGVHVPQGDPPGSRTARSALTGHASGVRAPGRRIRAGTGGWSPGAVPPRRAGRVRTGRARGPPAGGC